MLLVSIFKPFVHKRFVFSLVWIFYYEWQLCYRIHTYGAVPVCDIIGAFVYAIHYCSLNSGVLIAFISL